MRAAAHFVKLAKHPPGAIRRMTDVMLQDAR